MCICAAYQSTPIKLSYRLRNSLRVILVPVRVILVPVADPYLSKFAKLTVVCVLSM
jgi:hypothetical protein